MKVVQTLYSFLLVEKQFSIESSPSAPTKEKRFAYSLYLDTLVLLIRIARSIERRRGEKPLADTRFISRLLNDEQIRSLMTKYDSTPFPLQSLVAPLASKIEESGIYKAFLKERDRDESNVEETVWSDIFNHIIAPAPEFRAAADTRENASLKGFERMKEMMNETLRNFLASQDNVDEVIRELKKSLGMARELFFRLLRLPVDITDLEERILDDNRHKFLKNSEDINPNMRFVENSVVQAIRDNEMVNAALKEKDHKFDWNVEEPEMLRHLLHDIKMSEAYQEYMEAPMTNARADGELWRELFKRVILENGYFLQALEDKSVFWNDDLDIISTFVLKSIRRLEEPLGTEFHKENGDKTGPIPEMYKDEEDRDFGPGLVRAVYRNKEVYRGYINDALDGGNWESERLAFMDVVILLAAIAEIMNYPKIPISVSVNEYIEIAKAYSTSRSGQFVNGLLGAIISRLQDERLLFKR